MEYSINLDATWRRLKSPEIASKLNKLNKKAIQWGSGSNHDLSGFPREIQMVPVYLELASYKGKPRFNPSEITEITGFVKMYNTKISYTDLVKQLLDIGLEKGTPLSVKEIKDFLSTTALMKKEEQNNLIRFIKSLKENAQPNSEKNPVDKSGNSTDLIQYKAYTSRYDTDAESVSKLINLNNLGFAYGITRCKNPEILAIIAQKMGAMWEISVVPNCLVQAYEISNGNMALVQDLLRGFYPWEIDEIVSKLSLKPNSADLSKYQNHTYSTDFVTVEYSTRGLEAVREIILYELGLSDQIKLTGLDYSKKIKTVDGSFEQGKRR